MSDPSWLDEEPPHLQPRSGSGGKWVARIGLGALLLGIVGLVAWGGISLMSGGKSGKKQVVQLSLLKPPPPPPPPPQTKPPEPEPPKEEVKIPEPEQRPEPAQDDAPPPGDQLGMEEGGGSGDGFGLVHKSGTDITKLGTGGGLGKDRSAWFGGVVRSHLQSQLARVEKLRDADYRIHLRVWFAPDGHVERYELVDSTGNAELDASIRVAMDKMPPLRQAPPQEVPQPVRLLVVSKLAG